MTLDANKIYNYDGMKVKIGDPVKIFIQEKNKTILYDGEFLGEENIEITDSKLPNGKNEVWENNVKLKIDNGRIVWGFECWWQTLDEFNKNEK